MLENIALDRVYYLDIETVPQYPSYEEMPDHFKELWDIKSEKTSSIQNEQSAAEIYERAGIYAEFGKIICISVGVFVNEGTKSKFRIKSFYNDDEKMVLEQFSDLMNRHFNEKTNFLCAHNGKEFDFPYIARRLVCNNMLIPGPLDNWGKKPWETEHLIDTMQMWRFGDYKSYTSLNLLCATLKIPTPKDDIQGKDVAKVYWQERDLARIVKYCEKDVVAIARLMQRYKGFNIFSDDDIIIVK